jgi:GNAT superfamily N-acetyltransferase
MERWQALGRIQTTVTATIRPCMEDDLPALEWMGLFAPDRDIIREAFETQERGGGMMLLATAADFPIAQVWLDFERRNPAVFLWAVRTFHPLRGAGIGRRMMQAAETVASDRGFRRAELDVERENEAALGFYLGLGWHIEVTGTAVTGRRDRRFWTLAKEIGLTRQAFG